MKVKIKRLCKDSIIPNYVYLDDAGMDLYCIESFSLAPGERRSVSSGLAFEIPRGYVGLIWDKSGLSHKYGLKTFGGVLDAGYRGELFVGLMNLSSKAFRFEKGHKIAQILIQKIEHVEIKEVKKLSISKRGKGGLGSTGK